MPLMTSWQPFKPSGELQREMNRFRREMNQLFGRWANTESWPNVAGVYPAVNLWADDDFVYAEAELPGLKLADLEITITGDNQLTIKGERKQALPEHASWHRRERAADSFERTIELPVRVDAGKVDARLDNGVLTIKMAKSPEAKPRKIPVKAQ